MGYVVHNPRHFEVSRPQMLITIPTHNSFNDQEIVALVGAHALGRCHSDRSGFEGPWTFSPTSVTNEFYKLLMNEKWVWKKWSGPKQLEDKKTQSLMMLPTDMALREDGKLRPWVVKYSKDEDAFFEDFARAFGT